jgi:uncharacterized membrane protein (GlpM family)
VRVVRLKKRIRISNRDEGIMPSLQFFLRFVVGGLLFATLPVVARQAGTGLAGRLMTGPWSTAISLYVIYLALGRVSASNVAKAGLPGLIPIALYLVCMWWLLGRGMTFWPGVLVLQFAGSIWTWLLLGCVCVLGFGRIIVSRFSWAWLTEESPVDGERIINPRGILLLVMVPPLLVAGVIAVLGYGIRHAAAGVYWTLLGELCLVVFRKPVTEIITGKSSR